jgi:hypothetical protein
MDEAAQRAKWHKELDTYLAMLQDGIAVLKSHPSPPESPDLHEFEVAVRRVSHATHELHFAASALFGMERGRFPLLPF